MTQTAGAQPRSGWPKRLTLLLLCFLATFVCYIDRVNISVAAIAMQEAFAWSETTKGLVLSSFFIGYLLFQAPSGWLANRFGGKLVMGVAIAWWSLFTVLTPLAAMISLPALYMARIAMGLGEAATFPAAYYLGARWYPRAERSRFVAVLLSGVPMGTLFALLTTGWIVTQWGWPAAFYLFGAFGLIAAALWFALVWDSPAQHPRISDAERAALADADDKRGASGPTPWRTLLTKPAVWALAGSWLDSAFASGLRGAPNRLASALPKAARERKANTMRARAPSGEAASADPMKNSPVCTRSTISA